MKILALILTAASLVSYAEPKEKVEHHADNAKQAFKEAGSKTVEAISETKNAVTEKASAAKSAISNKATAVKNAATFTNDVANFLNKVREDEKRTGCISSALATAKFPNAIHPNQLSEAREIILNTWPATRAALKFSRIEHVGSVVKFVDDKGLGVDLDNNIIYIQYDSAKAENRTNKVGVSVVKIHVDFK